jgi:hypothetical protein
LLAQGDQLTNRLQCVVIESHSPGVSPRIAKFGNMTWIVTVYADVRYRCPVDGQATASVVEIRLNGQRGLRQTSIGGAKS